MACFEQDLNEAVLIGAFFARGDNHTGGMLTMVSTRPWTSNAWPARCL